MIYLDNSATSFPKPSCVIRELNNCVRKYCGNPGRSSHLLSLRSSEAIYEAREKIASLLSVEAPEGVVFTYNATYALNLAIKSFITEKCHILTSDFEHNSVIRPLQSLAQRLGIEYSSFSTRGDIESNIKAALRPDTAGIVTSIASNLTGETVSLKVLSDIARERDIFLIIDASQAVGHIDIDLGKTPCDVLCAPGHKALFGIQGSGFAYFKDKERRDSFIEGGSGSDSISLEMPRLLPEAYEAGTLATPAIVSLSCGVGYIREIGIDSIRERLDLLCEQMRGRLATHKEIILYESGLGILPFNIRGLPSSLVTDRLNDLGICSRGGLHCSPAAHRRLGTLEGGAVRLSFSYLNNIGQVDKAYSAIKGILAEL
jgi:selenocysteine lyase/cysteine desulfurase